MTLKRSGSVAGIALAAGYIGWVAMQVGIVPFLESWVLLPPTLLMLTIALLVASYLARAARVQSHFRGQEDPVASPAGYPFAAVLRITLQHNALNLAVPMRAGEISFPLLFRQRFEVPVATGATALFWLRLLDLQVLLSLALAALILLLGLMALDPVALTSHAGMVPQTVIRIVEQEAGILLVSAILLLLVWQWAIPLGARLARHLTRDSESTNAKSRKLKKQIRLGVPENKLLLRSWSWTLLNWGLKLGALAMLLASLMHMGLAHTDLPLTGVHEPSKPSSFEIPAALTLLAIAFLAVVTAELTAILPIHAPLGLGTYPLGMWLVLVLGGWPSEAALVAATSTHLAQLGVALGLGLIAWLTAMVPDRNGNDDTR